MKEKEINTCIVYRHIRLDTNMPFYIGIGKSEKRAYSKNRSNLWHKIVNKTDYKVQILFENLTWQQACEKEIELIQLYGRIDLGTGTLTNMTDGGEGTLNLSLETRKRLSDAMKDNIPWNKDKRDIYSEDTKEKISTSLKKYFEDLEAKQKLSDSKKGSKANDETRLKMSKSQQERFSHSAGTMLNKTHSEETRKKMSLKQKGELNPMYGKTLSEEARKKISDARKGKTLTSEHKARVQVTMRFNKNLKAGLYDNLSETELEQKKQEIYNFYLNRYNS